ncbi:MAG TPA: response regulator [Thermoanaerobaculia bacterium]|nr:response regulator [Thermoanaerobaculia bacterium]
MLDDDAAILRLVTTLLRRAGYGVDIATKGAQAIHALERKPYAVVLLDIMMPTEGGMTVIRHLREHDPELLKRVLLLTGMPESALRSVREGVAGVVHKPFDAEELIEAVKKAAA